MDKGRWVDLHTHTTASDGDLTPSDLVALALRMGLAAVAITDHDTLEGIPEALARAEGSGMEVIPGVEISVEMGDRRTCHLLGYHVELDHPDLRAVLHRLQRARAERNERILERLALMGKTLDLDLLARCSGGGQVGRPHLAQAMVAHGYVASVEEAFRRFLGKGCAAYAEKYRLSPEEAIPLVISAGGVPVLGHPHTLGFEVPLELEAFVAKWVEKAGLMGIEAVHPDNGPDDEAHCRYLADKYGLIMTGGTDFHGRVKPEVALGWGRGDLRVPVSWAERLRQNAIALKGQSQPR
jgi:hypothetical protein